MTRIAKRNTLLTIQYPVNGARDASGRKEQQWNTYGNTWAHLRKVGGTEVSDGVQSSYYSTFECRIPFVDAPTLIARWRLRQGSSEPYTYYEVQSADQNEFDRKEWILTVIRDDRAQVDAGVIEN